MPKYIVDLHLDGYDTDEKREHACAEYIYNQLNMAAACVTVTKLTGKADRLDELERENAALRNDKERYEWLKDGKGSHWAYNYLRDNFRINDDAIDAARAKEGGAS